ncbi:MAG TPA: extracellular solute-binding protein [Thermoanaerobaculia bacterium]|nr:extracellular solute-binding protein [Thermoanaerobaculia bacterium]
MVSFWAFGREGEMVRELVPEFERRNPGLRVDVQQVPWTAAHEKLLTAYVGNATPDVAQLGNTWIAEFVALEALAPLDERLAGSRAIARGDFFAGAWDANVLDGATWGVPWYVDTRVLFYRSDLMAASGAPWPPRTWAEWREAMARVRRVGGAGERYAILMPIDEWDKPVLLGLQAGAPLLAGGGRRGAFRDPRFRRALAFYVDLYASGLAPPLTSSGVSNLYQQFEEGYFAMLVTGPWNLGEFRNRLPASMQERWATAPLPPPDAAAGYPGVSLAGGSSLVLFRDAAGHEGAWKLVEFLCEPAQQARFYELSGDLPARRSAWALTALDADPRAAAFREQLGAVVPMPKVPEWEQIATRVAERVEEVVRGASTLDAALAGLDADVDRMLEKRRWLLDRAAAAPAER